MWIKPEPFDFVQEAKTRTMEVWIRVDNAEISKAVLVLSTVSDLRHSAVFWCS